MNSSTLTTFNVVHSNAVECTQETEHYVETYNFNLPSKSMTAWQEIDSFNFEQILGMVF